MVALIITQQSVRKKEVSYGLADEKKSGKLTEKCWRPALRWVKVKIKGNKRRITHKFYEKDREWKERTAEEKTTSSQAIIIAKTLRREAAKRRKVADWALKEEQEKKGNWVNFKDNVIVTQKAFIAQQTTIADPEGKAKVEDNGWQNIIAVQLKAKRKFGVKEEEISLNQDSS